MNIVVIAIDRLHAGYLGCYGNTWVATPAFDRLAAEGFVFQQAIIDSPDLADAYEAMWRGTHAAERGYRFTGGPAGERAYGLAGESAGGRPGETVTASLAELARRNGARTLLLTDEPTVADHPAAEAFDETIEWEEGGLQTETDDEGPAAEVEATHAARFFAEASEHVVTDRPFLLWLHTRGLGGAWDAPAAFRDRYVDEDDPPAPTFTRLATRRLPPEVDLDERFGLAQAYAGQVTLTDLCLGGFLAHLDETGLAENTAVVLVSPRGIALGEHDDVGTADERLHAEIVQVPWIVRLPKSAGKLRRTQALVQPCDLYHTLAALPAASPMPTGWGRNAMALFDGRPAWRDRAIVGGRATCGIRTAAWYLLENVAGREPAAEGEATGSSQLFAKPDDWWEVNDVADRCPEIVERLGEARRATVEAMAAGRAVEPLVEDDPLVAGLN